ncbi:MAG TPA: ABC transporter permease [Ktedonobacterales bacterium]|nr:ABC transporter permease [Ktedonobacterales bacterium]
MSVRATATGAGKVEAPRGGAAPVAACVRAQTRAELNMTLRQGERVLITVILPAFFLVFFASTNIVPAGMGKPVDFLLPGMLAVAIMSTGMVSLGIATAYDRYYGVLKRLGSSPLPRWGLIVAKLLAVLAVEVGQIVLLVLLAVLFFGWRPAGPLWSAAPIVLLGTAAFAGLGMLMAGALRATTTLAGANGLYILFLAIGGVILPTNHLPPVITWVANLLPAAALSDALRGALTTQGMHGGSVLLLVFWAVVILAAAVRTFKWE